MVKQVMFSTQKTTFYLDCVRSAFDLTFECQRSNRFHNNTVLERQSDSMLVLKDVRPQQAGDYHCKASSPAGAIKTKPASLTVLGLLSWKSF